MAKSTFLELVNRTIQECGISGNGAVAVTNQRGMILKVVTWVKNSDVYIQKVYRDWNFLHKSYSASTIANTKDYVKPTDLGMWDRDSFFLNYTQADAQPLTEEDYGYWRNNLGQGVQDTTIPDSIIIKPNKDLILYPTPDDVYTLTSDYWKTPTKMVNDGDTSDIPETFEDVIVFRAKLLYAKHEEGGDIINDAREEYEIALSDLIANEAPGQLAKNIAHIDDIVRVE